MGGMAEERFDTGREDDVMDADDAEEYEAHVVDAGVLEDELSLVPGDEDPRDAGLHETILSEEEVWSGRIFTISDIEVELPNGHRAGRDVVRHCQAAAVVALTHTGKIVLVRQYRTAIDRVTVEIPAGKCDAGEDPLDCAKRELEEETGFVPGKIRHLLTLATSVGFCDELIYMYLATDLELAGAHPDEDEFVNVDLVPVSELVDAVLDGKIEDAKTIIAALACDAIANRLGSVE